MEAPVTSDQFLPEVYSELRRLARSYLRNLPSGATLQPTALVHEAFLHLRSTRQPLLESRSHFLGVAALAMRQVIGEHYRRSSALKRGGDVLRVELSEDGGPSKLNTDYLDLDRALNRLEADAPELSRIVELRFFGGMSADECAEFLAVSTATINRRWSLARAWLYRELSNSCGTTSLAEERFP